MLPSATLLSGDLSRRSHRHPQGCSPQEPLATLGSGGPGPSEAGGPPQLSPAAPGEPEPEGPQHFRVTHGYIALNAGWGSLPGVVGDGGGIENVLCARSSSASPDIPTSS